jgi:hypothetical protein
VSWRHVTGQRGYLAAVTALLLLTGAALLLDGTHGVWARRPFLGGLATGAVSLAFTILILERVVASRDNRRWDRVAKVAYRGLARETRGVSAGLAALYVDEIRRPEEILNDPSWDSSVLHPVNEIRAAPAERTQMQAAFALAPGDQYDTERDLLPVARVEYLVADPAWVAMAERWLHALLDNNRHAVAQWAPLMMASDNSRDMLDAFASLNDELFSLILAVEELDRRSIDAALVERVVQFWRITDGKARLLTNELWRQADEGHYSLILPTALHGHDPVRCCRRLGQLPVALP